MIRSREKLFHEWARLEPQRCVVDGQGGFTVGKTLFRSFAGSASDAMLRREVQQALEERGWEWQVDLGDPIHARVLPAGEPKPVEAAYGTPGEALLSAYLAALKRN